MKTKKTASASLSLTSGEALKKYPLLRTLFADILTDEEKEDLRMIDLRIKLNRCNLPPEKLATAIKDGVEPKLLGKVCRILLLNNQ